MAMFDDNGRWGGGIIAFVLVGVKVIANTDWGVRTVDVQSAGALQQSRMAS
jgi:hypothetical protein